MSRASKIEEALTDAGAEWNRRLSRCAACGRVDPDQAGWTRSDSLVEHLARAVEAALAARDDEPEERGCDGSGYVENSKYDPPSECPGCPNCDDEPEPAPDPFERALKSVFRGFAAKMAVHATPDDRRLYESVMGEPYPIGEAYTKAWREAREKPEGAVDEKRSVGPKDDSGTMTP